MKKILQEKIQSRDKEWFSKGGNRSRVKRFFKTKQLDSALLFDLWTVRELRYDLVSLQRLPEDIVIEIITNAGNKKRNITKAMYTEALVKQEISNKIVTQYIQQGELGLYLIAWETIPKTMLLYGDWNTFLKNCYWDEQ